MYKYALSIALFLLFGVNCIAQKQDWTIEAEDAGSTVSFDQKRMIDIVAPKGLTLWHKQLMEGNTVIEYEARIVADKKFCDEKGKVRVSDLNCFWMADECGGCGGKFVDNYALTMYYMGYGGNWNSTTRFRRYSGDKRGVDSAQYRPIILKEYTDVAHLLKADKWYKIRLESTDGHVRYWIDGECLVDYVDPAPLVRGYFGFRTTMAHAQMRNFRYSCTDPDKEPIVVRRIDRKGSKQKSVATFGVPFAKGEKNDDGFTIKTADGNECPFATWRLASWQDGSAKWQAFCVSIPKDCDSVFITKERSPHPIPLQKQGTKGFPPFYVTVNGKVQNVLSKTTERTDNLHTITKYSGKNFIIRTYDYNCTNQKKLVHTLLVDSTLNKEGLNELSIHFKVPMHGEAYERYVRFNDGRKMSVQPLIARRNIDLKAMDETTQNMLANIAKWDGFRMSQLSYFGHSIRKRATSVSPWIGTEEHGAENAGRVTIGDSTMHTSFELKDFAESYPSTLQVDGARSDTAIVTISLYSPEAEAYSFEHYDTIAHTLQAAYEDVQAGMSTAWGIGRTSTMYIKTVTQPLTLEGSGGGYELRGSMSSADLDDSRLYSGEFPQFCCTPEYLHRKRAFGVWSLPTVESSRDSIIEATIGGVMDFYKKEIRKNAWYGYFNYGDVMHAYDRSRESWRYDVGGYAWDNTELGSPAMLWYQFIRTGDADVWKMAEAMTRHCSEVDTYHFGPHAGLGSRHNVTHWGCGAKESRISEAWWNHFYYYLTADERIGDIMHEVIDADTLLYTLDPMRLAQPIDMYPNSAPARLRIGPDWMGYVSNWFVEWERTANTKYLDKIKAGMTSIANLPNKFFQGPQALGYDPATGVISTDMPEKLATSHLATIMGGFETMNEVQMSVDHPQYWDAWLEFCRDYRDMAFKVSKNKFRIPRLSAYAGWRLGDEKLKSMAWDELLPYPPLDPSAQIIWTNTCATWTVDAIFLKEVINNDKLQITNY